MFHFSILTNIVNNYQVMLGFKSKFFSQIIAINLVIVVNSWKL